MNLKKKKKKKQEVKASLLNQSHQFPPNRIPRPRGPLRRQDLLQPGVQIDILTLPHPRITPKHHPMTHIKQHKRRDPNIRGEKVRRAPIRREKAREAIDKQQKHRHTQADVDPVRLQTAFIRLLDPLHFHGGAEPEVHDAAADPGDEAGGVGEVDQPVEDGVGAGRDGEVGEEGEERGHRDGDIGHAPPVACFED